MTVDASAQRVLSPPPSATAGAHTNAQAWFLVFALSVASVVAYVDRQVMSLLVTPIKADLNLSDTQASLLVGLAFVVSFSIFGLFAGWIADRGNRKRLVMIGIAFWSAATMACGGAQSFAQLFAARVAVGAGESALSPSAMSMLSDAFSRERLPRALSVYTSASFFGMGLALVLGGAGIQAAMALPPLVLPDGTALKSWQMAFFIVGAVGVIAMVPLALAREPKRQAVAATAQEDGREKMMPFLSRHRWTFLCMFAGYSLNAMSGLGATSWLPTFFMRTHGWAPHEVGYVYGAVIAFVSPVAVLLGPRIGEWVAKRGMKDVLIRFPLICLITATVPSILAFIVPDPRVAMGLVAVKQFIITLPMALMAASFQLITPGHLRGRVAALYLFIGNITAVAAGPILVAVITDYVYRDEAHVGLSIITNTAILVPLASLCLWLGIKHFRHTLEEAEAAARAA